MKVSTFAQTILMWLKQHACNQTWWEDSLFRLFVLTNVCTEYLCLFPYCFRCIINTIEVAVYNRKDNKSLCSALSLLWTMLLPLCSLIVTILRRIWISEGGGGVLSQIGGHQPHVMSYFLGYLFLAFSVWQNLQKAQAHLFGIKWPCFLL